MTGAMTESAERPTKYIFVTGGVVSSLGKGIAAASIGRLLKERGLRPERNYEVREAGTTYRVPLAIPCRDGRIELIDAELPESDAEVVNLADELTRAVAARGGERPY